MDQSQPKFLPLGAVNGYAIIVEVSRGNCFADVPADMKPGCAHLIANPQDKLTRAEAYEKGITPGKVLDLIRDEKGNIKPEIIEAFFPNHVGQQFGARNETNDTVTATMDTVHMHIEIALAEYWKRGLFRRCVDSILAPRYLVISVLEKMGAATEELKAKAVEFFTPSPKDGKK